MSTTLRATRLLNSNRVVAPPDMGKEWAIDRIAFAVLRNTEDAEDALQDGLCKAFTSLHSLQGRSSFSTWLTRIVINAALMTRRRNSAHSQASLDQILDDKPGQLPHGMVDARPDAERVYAAIEIDALVEVHVRLLSPLLQTPFRLSAQ